MKRWIHASTGSRYTSEEIHDLIVNNPNVHRADPDSDLRHLFEYARNDYDTAVKILQELIKVSKNNEEVISCDSYEFGLAWLAENFEFPSYLMEEATESKRLCSYLAWYWVHSPNVTEKCLENIILNGYGNWAAQSEYLTDHLRNKYKEETTLPDLTKKKSAVPSIKPNTKFNLTKKRNLSDKWFEWAGTDDVDECISILEDNGYVVVNSLADACNLIYENSSDLEDALSTIEYAYGNSEGIIPLADFDLQNQYSIYTQWLKKTHPKEI